MHAPSTARRWVLQKSDYERLAKAAAVVFEPEPAVLAAYLYGSAAREEPAADLDVAVLLQGTVNPQRLERLAALLQAQGAPRGPEIDLRPLGGAAPRFQASVLKEGRLLFDRDRERRLEQEARIMSRWADFRPVWEKMKRRMFDRWLGG